MKNIITYYLIAGMVVFPLAFLWAYAESWAGRDTSIVSYMLWGYVLLLLVFLMKYNYSKSKVLAYVLFAIFCYVLLPVFLVVYP